jgi:enolase-phosphatase E1
MVEMIQAVVTDIEGTTTPAGFVTQTLFPYARQRLPAFIRDHLVVHEVAEALADARQLASDPTLSDEAVIGMLLQWIDEDRKATPLKTLQGLVWADGYAAGAFQGALYDDVAPMLRAWRARGLRLFGYSSGSQEAQRLLFRHSSHGDLTALFEGFFDTRLGGKLNPDSYHQLARTIAVRPVRILFLSDHLGELDAAAAAGFATACLERDTPTGRSGRHSCHGDFYSVEADYFAEAK